LEEAKHRPQGNAPVTETRWANPATGFGEGQASGAPPRRDDTAAGLMQAVQRIVSDIETFKWERVAEPVWAARVEVASVYFRKRRDAPARMPRAA
jgi:hypothetical protein